MSAALDFWQGPFGDEYHRRNADEDINARIEFWCEVLRSFDERPDSIAEIGAGTGTNLEALRRIGFEHLTGVEPHSGARDELIKAGFVATPGTATAPRVYADLVFTSGVLIHIPPEELHDACRGIYQAAQRYIVSVEYFAADPEEKTYRGHAGRLWKRDFGAYWLNTFDLEPLGCGFAWKPTTGLDNLTWWALRKQEKTNAA